MPLIIPNLIALGQTMYEKNVTIILHPSVFWRGTPGPKFTNPGIDVQQVPLYQSAEFRPFLTTYLYEISAAELC